MKTHELKTINPYFQEVWDGNKTFEVRFNDRDFQVEDFLILKEYDHVKKEFIGREVFCQITYILDDPSYCKEGYVILAIKSLWRYI